MSINENYYGSQNSGIDVYNNTFYGHTINIKKPAWPASGNYALQGTYLAKAVSDSSAIKAEIDTSIAHCGIGQKGDFLEWTYTDREGNEQTEILTAHYEHYIRNMHWLSLKRDITISTPQGNVTAHFGIDKDDDFNDAYSTVDIPVWLTQISRSNTNNQRTFSAIQYTDNTIPSYYHWGNDDTQTYANDGYNSLGYNSPLIKYGLGDIVFVIYVYCASTTGGSGPVRVQLADYLNTSSTYNYTNRPYVGAVYATPATWTSGSASSRTLTLLDNYVPSFNRKFSITAPYYSVLNPNTDDTKTFYYYDMQQSYQGTGGAYAYGMYNIFCTSNVNNGSSWTTETQSYPSNILPRNTPVQTYHYYYVAGYDFWQSCGFGEWKTGGSSGSYTMDTCLLHVQNQSQANKLKQYAFEMCAYLGVFFSDRIVTATVDTTLTTEEQWKQAFTDENIYCGIIDENGLTHGFYTHGQGNTSTLSYGNDNAQNATPYVPTPFNPDIPPTPTDENDKGDLNTHLNSGYYATSAKYYATTEQQITKLIDFINTYAPTDAELTADFKGVNPSDYITNVLFFPFDVMYSGAASPIYLSVLNTTAIGLKFSPSFGVTVADFGGISIDRYFNDFRDFAPYTKLSINIPFANTVDLDIGEYYGHTLNIKAVIDFTTGDILTLIMRDGLVVKTVSGNCAIQLPLSALAMSTYQQTLNTLQSNANINDIQANTNDIMTISNTGVSMIGAAMSTGATTLISNPLNTVVGGTAQRDILAEQAGQINYAIKHTTPSPMTISGGTPCNMAMLEYLPRYTITRCKTLNNIDYNTYSYTVGYATAQQGRVSDFTGFIVCSDVEFDTISATAAEQEIIKNMLKSGVVI